MPDWHIPTTHPKLASQQVHIWRTSLDVVDSTHNAFRRILSSDELERAQRFVFERDRQRYIVARSVLRSLLAAYVQVHPSDLVFGYEQHGKPFLARPHGATPISFNLSHSDEWAVYGFTQQGRIGIDIECHRSLKDMHRLAASVFSEQELAALHTLPAHQQQAAFYAGWTRKEAFIKACGEGLAFSLKRFDVSLTPGEPACLLRVDADPAAALHWHMSSFTPAHNISGAVVVEGQQFDVMFWHFP